MQRSRAISVLAALALGGLVAQGAAAGDDAPTLILITNVDVWDGTSDEVSGGTDVLIEGNRIKQIGKSIEAAGAHVIDGQGGTVTPGLIDMHQHLILNGGTSAGSYDWDAYTQGAHASRAAEYLLRSGFTTIRDIAGNTLSLKRAINAGILPGPRVYSSGGALGPTGSHTDWGSYNDGPGQGNYQTMVRNAMVADGVPEWLRAGRWNFKSGADFLKVMAGGGVASVFDPIDLNSPSLEEMKAAVQVANEYGGYVAIHSYTDAAYNKSMDAGVKSFEHGFLISEKTVKRMKKEGVWFSWQAYASYNTFGMGNFPDWFTADMRAKGAAVAEGSVRVPKLMKKHGVKMFAGSDLFGWDNWDKAIVNVAYPVEIPGLDFTSLDCMKMSTSNAGRALRELSAPSRNPFKEAKLGVVEEGAWADVLIWKGSPIQDVRLIVEPDNLLLIMKDGKLYKNLTVEPGHESFRGGVAPSAFSWSM
jgi:imidazolonepropionase-like amidohydrolase